ncbi:tRNA pseudouridine(13) synthase TruD [Candidatus Woesearchaeota archaeon]|nr:tRNA pseudouridine(13) synthase TruD [Candidatus Woesearchaeota archaeon]
MHKIKQIPEDFIVKEVNNLKLDDDGQYCYFFLKKRYYNTLDAIKIISEKLRINEKYIGFAGNKDKNAVTEQVISIKNGNKNIQNIKLKDIELKFIGRGNENIFIGSNNGNEFTITIRNLANKEIKTIENKIKNNRILMPNFFGPQRFSNNNAEIGKSIIKKDFKKAVELIVEANSDFKNEMLGHIEKKPNDYVVALKIIPLKLLKLYIHSYQSFLFNKALEQLIKDKKITKNNQNKKNAGDNKNKIIDKIPIIGFGTELEGNETGKIINKIMEKENIGIRDFIIRQIPELSSEGDERKAFIEINDFEIIKKEKDELNKNREKIIVKFSLPKGCYATVLIGFLLN